MKSVSPYAKAIRWADETRADIEFDTGIQLTRDDIWTMIFDHFWGDWELFGNEAELKLLAKEVAKDLLP